MTSQANTPNIPAATEDVVDQLKAQQVAAVTIADSYRQQLVDTVEPADTLIAGTSMLTKYSQLRGVSPEGVDAWVWVFDDRFGLPAGWSTAGADGEGVAMAREEFAADLKPVVISVPESVTFAALPLVSGDAEPFGLFAIPLRDGPESFKSIESVGAAICAIVVAHVEYNAQIRASERSLQFAQAAARAQRRLVEPVALETALEIAIDALSECEDLLGGAAVELSGSRQVATFGDVESGADESDEPRHQLAVPIVIEDATEAELQLFGNYPLGDVESGAVASIAAAVAGAVARFRASATIESLRRSTTRRLVEAQERERSMVAADIHDGVLQQLGATAIRLELAQSRVEQRDFDTASSIIADGAREIRFCTRELRALLMELRPQVLDDNGLNAALAELGRHVEDVEVTVNSDLEEELGQEFSITVFRIVQEALTNIQKHSQAEHATVDVHVVDDAISIDISDDGIGYEGSVTGPSSEGSHLGLLGMRERARMFGGTFSVSGQSGAGTQIHATLPLDGLSETDPLA